MRHRSRKRARQMPKWRAYIAMRIEAQPRCQINWGGCSMRATTLHHRLKRSAMPSARLPIEDEAWNAWQFVETCNTCNSQIEDYPEKARNEGWTVRAHQAAEEFPHLFDLTTLMFVGQKNR